MKCEGSLLHPKIAKFYKISEKQSVCGDVGEYVNDNCTYNWKKLAELLLNDVKLLNEDPAYPRKYDEWLRYFELLTPVLRQSDQALQTTSLSDDWLSNFRWLGHQGQMQITLTQHFNPTSETSVIENVLFLTSILENGLGNLCYTVTDRYPPHLLRDLLDTEELRSILGTCPVFFLKILMGSPDSVNLRNVVWHGFPLPSEIPRCYTSTLLIAATSIFQIIKERNLTLETRSQVTGFSRFTSKIKTALDLNLLDDEARIERSIKASKWTSHSNHMMFWKRALQHYHQGHYWQFVVIILPQIELILRRMYGEANNFDITAKLDEYYITLSSVFEPKDNRLLSGVLPRGTLHLLYDLFISQYGMRIRDKVSHGEVDLNCVDKDLCSILLYVGLNLVTSNKEYPLNHYESRSHLNRLTYDCIVAAKNNIFDLTSLQVPTDFQNEFRWTTDSLRQLEITKPLEIFHRHKKEPEIMTSLMRITQLVAQVCVNYKECFSERFRQFLNHTLRSRARKTLDKMVQSMPIVEGTLVKMVKCIVALNNSLQANSEEWIEDVLVEVQKFCKQTLTIVENMVRFSDKESNEWVNVLDYCKRFEEISERLTSRIRS